MTPLALIYRRARRRAELVDMRDLLRWAMARNTEALLARFTKGT